MLFAVLILLAVSNVESALLSSRYSSSINRTFSVPRTRQNTKRCLDGFSAHAKVFRKYGWSNIPVKSDVFVAPADRQIGSVNATAEEYDAAYISPVAIGSPGQQLNLDFDTGSSDFWMFNDRLGTGATAGHRIFNSSQSTTFRNTSGLSWRITYGDGSGAAGVVGKDTVNIGGATVTSQAIELATAVSRSFIADIGSDGLVGLGFKKLNRGTDRNGFPSSLFSAYQPYSLSDQARHILRQHQI